MEKEAKPARSTVKSSDQNSTAYSENRPPIRFGIPPKDSYTWITPVERKVWQGIAMGKTRKEIGVDLGCAETEVASKLRAIRRKTGADGIANLTRAAIAYGLITVEPVQTTKS